MYVPVVNRETRPEMLHSLMRDFGFATLVTHGPAGLVATPLPVLVDPTRGAHGVLRSHMARANGHWREFAGGAEALVIFQGPHAYVSPTWYVSPVSVPTWNYATVHAYGTPTILEDDAAVARVLDDTVAHFEAGMERPWSAAKIAADVAAGLLRQVVAFEIELTRVEGKWKLGQNRPAADRKSAGEALARSSDPLAAAMGRMMVGSAGEGK